MKKQHVQCKCEAVVICLLGLGVKGKTLVLKGEPRKHGILLWLSPVAQFTLLFSRY